MSYEPNEAVRDAHGIPHLSPSFQQQSATISTSAGYFESLVVFPGFLLALGLFSLFVFLAVLISRCCCTCSKCGPSFKPNEKLYDFVQWKINVQFWKRTVLYGFIASLLSTIIAIHIIFYGNAEFNTGVYQAINALVNLGNVFTDTSNYITDIDDQINLINAQIFQSGCVPATDYTDAYLNSITSYTQDISGLIGDIPNVLQSARNYVIQYVINDKNSVVFSFYAVIIVVCFSYIPGIYFNYSFFTKSAIAVSYLIVLALTIICCIEMVIVVSISLNIFL